MNKEISGSQALLEMLFAKDEPTEEEMKAAIDSFTKDEVIAWSTFFKEIDLDACEVKEN